MIAIGTPVFGVAMALGYYSIAKELDAKFFAVHDSVPTKIYSAVYWLKPGVGASSEELRFRLAEREYKEQKSAENVAAPGTYYLESAPGGAPLLLVLYTNELQLPEAARDILLDGMQLDPGARRYEIHWKDGRVEKIMADSAEEMAVPLEPVLVAQLNEGGIQARKTVPISAIPHTLMKAIVLVEDQRFLDHVGLDPRGILRSIYVNLRSGGYVQGASTITQQLTRNIYLSRQKTISRKLKEMAMAVVLELKFSKDQILEKYLNEVYFGQSGNIAVHGVSEAAKFYFGKSLDELSIAEQALLAGVVRGPFYYSPYRHWDRVKARQELVLKKMAEAGVITEAQFEKAVSEKIKIVKIPPVQNRAPYFTDMVQAQLLKDLPEHELAGAGYTIFSTLDTYYQKQAELAVSKGVSALESRLKQYLAKRKSEEETRLLQGVFIGADPETGRLLCLVGGRSYEESNYNRTLLMRRHIGSLIKPFVYLSALLYGKNPDGTPLNAISKYEDKPFTYEYDGKSWSPKNYEEEFAGTVTMRFALANSINTVAAQVAIETGLDKVVETAKLSGFESDLQPFPSLSLGAVEVPPVEIATAYNTLANFGMRKELTSILAVVGEEGRLIARFVPREEQALPPEEAANLVQMMTSTFEAGTARISRDWGFTWPAAGKTGTTNEFRDAWFAGFTSKLLGVSWVGFDRDDEVVRRHRKALRLTGAVAALPVWVEFMKAAHQGQAPLGIQYPDGMLRSLEVDLISGAKANYRCRGNSVVEEVFTYRNAPMNECQ